MKLHFDKFTIGVLVVVGVLLAAAIFTISRTNNSGEPATYLTEDAPATPVVNAFLAYQDGDIPKARAQYSQEVLDRVDKTEAGGYGPLRGEYYGSADANRRLRVLKEQIDDTNPDRAYVTVAIDNYSTGGLFNRGDTWSSERVVEVVREDGAWKLNSEEYFY
jgi:hypothetical protein